MKTRGKKSVQIVSTADIASAPSTSQSQLVTYPNSGPSTGYGPRSYYLGLLALQNWMKQVTRIGRSLQRNLGCTSWNYILKKISTRQPLMKSRIAKYINYYFKPPAQNASIWFIVCIKTKGRKHSYFWRNTF